MKSVFVDSGGFFAALIAEDRFHSQGRALFEQAERLRNEILLLREESRIKDARMEHIPPHRRPHCPPVERLATLELRAARGWSLTQTACALPGRASHDLVLDNTAR